MVCIVGVVNAKTEKVHATFENPSNTNTTWNGDTKTFTWSTTYYNQLRNIGLPSGDLTKYKKLVVDCTIKSGEQFRILFYKGGSNLTLYAKDGVNEFILKDALEAVAPNDYNEYLLACDEICLSGNNGAAPGEAIINDVYLETYNDEGEKVFATFENPSNTNTTWNGETKTFTWSTTYYNQLRNIGLPSGDISKYKKLVVDCTINSGEQFRILFYKGGSNLTLYAKDGVNEFILKEALEAVAPNDYNEYLLACDEICLSGNNGAAPGEAIINSVYLETYPENESVEIPEITYEEDPGKPAGDFVDLTEAFPSLQPKIGLGADEHPIVLGNGEVVVGARSQNVIADLSEYSKLTIVATPGLKLVLYMNHEVEAQQNAPDYKEEDAGKYVFMDVQAGEDGLCEVDLTQFDKQDLNAICLPWDNSNKGTVWYLLLTKGEAAPVAQEVTFDFTASNHAVSSGSGASYDAAGEITADEVNTVDGVVMTISPADEGANTPNRYWKYQDAPQLRMYSGKMTIEAPEGKAITKIEIEKGSKWSADNTFNGESAAEATWEGNSTNVILAVADNSQMNKVIVTLADKNEETTTYKEPLKPLFADGKYYINNVGTKKYLAAGADWGTHGVVNEVGLDYDIAFNDEDGTYTLNSQVSNGGTSYYVNGSDVNGPWNDGAAFGWTFTKLADGVYSISTGDRFISVGENDKVGFAADATAENAQWTLISAEEFLKTQLATMEAATAENPVDVTFLIKGTDFNRNDLRNNAWKHTNSGGNVNIAKPDGNRATYGVEFWNNTFDFSQTIENVLEGVYEFSISGYGSNGTTYIYANETSVAFVNTQTAANFATAVDAIANGEYTGNTTGKVNVIGNTLKIGIKRTEQVGQDWTVFDKAKLTYYGPVSADAYKEVYDAAMAAAKAAQANEAYAAVTGEEKTALEKAIADNETVEATAEAYKAAALALSAATDAFTAAKAGYEELANAKEAMKDQAYNYAAAEKKAAAEASLAAEAASAAEAKEKAAAIEKAYRQYAESSALLEGVEGATDMTQSITNPDAQAAIADPWAVVLGEGSGGSLGILDGEPLTDGEGNSAYKYFDGGNWGAQAWDVALVQKIGLPAGKYQLTASGRASADVNLQLFAGEDTVKIAAIGNGGGLYGRGWSDASVEFELAEADSVLIGVRGVTEKQYNWMSFTRFRLMQFPAAQEEIARIWDFTKWSDATVANLKADAAASKTSGWSDVEKKADAEADAEPTEASKDNCFWLQLEAAPADGVLTANGVEIAELKGLLFTDDATASSRNIAIAVNYPVADASKDFGPYAGGAYFWVGGKDRKFTIPNVAAGSTIIMEIESHKITDGRGVKLMQGDAQIGDAFQPKAKESHTWTIENAGDVAVVNTNGCHIYTIKVVEPAAPVVPDEPELVAPEGWTSEITNGNLAGDDVSNYVSKEYPSTTPVASAIVAGAGKNGSRGILVKSQDKASQPWDSQFWIKVNEQLPAGTKVHVEFDYKADKAGSVGTQTHGEPGSYLPGTAIGNVSFTTEWQHFSGEFDVATESNNMQSIAFNLNDIAEANNFYFDNFGVWVQKPKPVEKWADLIVNGDMEGESMECFYVTEQGVGGPFVAVATEGIGKDGGKAVKVQSADKPSQDWDTQFFVRLPYELPAGTKFKFSFDYKSDVAGSADTQCHNEPGQYIHYTCAGSPNFTNEWQHYEYEGMVASQCDGSDNKNEAGEFLYKKDFQTIAFNLAKNQVATVFIFDNVKFEVEESIVSSLTKDPAVDPKPYPVGIKTVNASKEDGLYYDLQGRRVAKPARGLYIINGKKVMVK